MTIFTELEKNHLKLHMEPKESPHSQDNPKQNKNKQTKNKARAITLPDFRIQSYSNQNSMVLVSKQHGTGIKTDI